jgi:putative hydrolase of the HAD superfamily
MPFSQVQDWIFDLDNTLYSGDAEFFKQIDKKMTAFVSRYLDRPPLEARKVQKQYLLEYGTTLSGLMAVHGMDPAEFLHEVHDIDLKYLTPDPNLRTGIDTLPGNKFIFTNGSQKHAKNVGEHLGIFDLFDGVFAIEDAGYVPKPKRSPYDKFINEFDINPTTAMMAEDSARNLEIPYAMGMKTLLITSQADWSHEPPHARPHDGTNLPDHVHDHTGDLSGWLHGLEF